MENENRLKYLKQCYKEIFNDKKARQRAINIDLESTYNYLMERIKNAQTEKEVQYFTVLLKRFVDPKHMEDDELLVLYESDKQELLMRVEKRVIAQTFFIDTNYPNEAFSTFSAELAFKHTITVDGVSQTIEDYLRKIAFDYSFNVKFAIFAT